jgi:hypothetical protein
VNGRSLTSETEIAGGGVHLDVRSGELVCEAPPGVMTPRQGAGLIGARPSWSSFFRREPWADHPAERHNWIKPGAIVVPKLPAAQSVEQREDLTTTVSTKQRCAMAGAIWMKSDHGAQGPVPAAGLEQASP